MDKPDFKYVNPNSNLAKAYFIDDFSGFVHYNKEYCDKIINRLEKDAKEVHQRQVEEHQKIYK